MKPIIFLFLWAPLWVFASVAPKLPANMQNIPLVRQATTYSCGAASLLAVLSYWQMSDGNESSLYKHLGTNEKTGTDSSRIVAYAQSLGLSAELKTNQTLAKVREKFESGHSVILDFQAWAEVPHPDWKNRWEDGHYAVLVGIDQDYLYFMDPSTLGSYAFIAAKEFIERWHDYEIKDGKRVLIQQMAIYIKGKNPRTKTNITRLE